MTKGPLAEAFDAHSSDGTIRNRFLGASDVVCKQAAEVAELVGCDLEVSVGEHVVLQRPSHARTYRTVEQSIRTHCAGPMVLTFLLPVNVDKETVSRAERALGAVASVAERLFAAEIGVHLLAGNMAHEVALLLVGTGIAARVVEEELKQVKEVPELAAALAPLDRAHRQIVTDCRLGLYLVRNFLAAISEDAYRNLVRPRLTDLDLSPVLAEMVELYARHASRRGIAIRFDAGTMPLTLLGDVAELKRAFNNVLSNAVKYSYASTKGTERYIEITVTPRYDSQKLKFAIHFENYGLGLTDEEQKRVFQHGFRGSAAANEVAEGSGIGLSEVQKIMKLHKGHAKMASVLKHEADDGGHTYVTTLTLVFPWKERAAR